MAEENSLGDGISLSPLLGTLRQLISDARSRALRCFVAVQRAQNGPACQPRHAPKKCSHASSRRRRAAG